MNAVHRRRLLNVARALRESPRPEAFNMEFYGYTPGGKHPCGTPACALGHYAARRDLQKACVLTEYDHVQAPFGRFFPWRDGHSKHFGISYEEFWELFDGTGCGEAKTPDEAADYIEDFVARLEAGLSPYGT